MARAAARRRRDEGKEEGGAKDGDGAEGENWQAVESMEVLEGGGGKGGGGASEESKFSELDRYSADDPSALRYGSPMNFLSNKQYGIV